MANPKPYAAPAVGRAVALLEHLAACTAPRRLSDLSRELDCSKSTLHGILGTLEEAGWVRREEGGYRVGEGLLAVAHRVFGVRELARVARPHLEAAARALGVSVFAGVRRGMQVVIQDCVEGGGEMQVAARPGAALPLFAPATGKVFLAGMGPDEARRLVVGAGLPRFTERSVTDPEVFLAQVEEVRRRGYAIDDEEYLRGVRAVAVPIRCGGATVAALWAVGIGGSLPPNSPEVSVRELGAAAAAIARQLEIEAGGEGGRQPAY